jgi:hypothetical protein
MCATQKGALSHTCTFCGAFAIVLRSAADARRVYVSNNNANGIAVDLTKMKAVPNVPGSKTPPTTTQGGLTAAVDAYDGTLLWTFANPTMHCES